MYKVQRNYQLFKGKLGSGKGIANSQEYAEKYLSIW